MGSHVCGACPTPAFPCGRKWCAYPCQPSAFCRRCDRQRSPQTGKEWLPCMLLEVPLPVLPDHSGNRATDLIGQQGGDSVANLTETARAVPGEAEVIREALDT